METVNSDIAKFVACDLIRNYRADNPQLFHNRVGYDESNIGSGIASDTYFVGISQHANEFSNYSGSGEGTAWGGQSNSGWDIGTIKDDAILEFNGHKVYTIDNLPTIIFSVKGNIAKGAVIHRDLTTTDCWIVRVGNYFAHGRTAKSAVEEAYAKWRICKPVEERIAEFIKKHPSLDTPYDDLFSWHHTLTGSCSLGRMEWCKQHGYKPTDSITVRTFIEQTKDAYGNNIIKQLAKQYGIVL